MNIKTLTDLSLENKTVLVRTDYDVPIADGKIVDDKRITNTLETINFLLSKNCRVIIISHLGRPEGKKVPSLSLKTVADHVQSLLPKTKVYFSNDVLGEETKKLIGNLKGGQILILENLRFDSREKENNEQFSQDLAKMADFYINEAFAVSHRKHASIVGIPKLLKSACGFQFKKEVDALLSVKKTAQNPIVVVLGGKKEDKLKFLELFSKWADKILVGGLLPRVAKKEGKREGKVVYASLTKDGKDITLKSAEEFTREIVSGKTVVWNGTMDLFEDRHNQAGTRIVATAVIQEEGMKIAGGGDTSAAIKQLNLSDKFNFISSGGGAMLELLAYENLVGLEAITKSKGFKDTKIQNKSKTN